MIMLSQCDLLHCNEYSLREYVETGKVDINQLIGILQSEGVKVSPEDLRAIVNGDHRTNQARGVVGFLGFLGLLGFAVD